MRRKIVPGQPRRFAFAEPVLIIAMLALIVMMALPRLKTLQVQARQAKNPSIDLHARENMGTRVEIVTPAEADLPAGVRLGTYAPFRIDDLP
jgi:Tfp pilus assembly protein FimT